MKRFLLATVLGLGVLVAGGCSSTCSAPSTCQDKPNAPECDRCSTEYCEYIGTRIYSDEVMNSGGKPVRFADGTIIQTLDKSKISKWEEFKW